MWTADRMMLGNDVVDLRDSDSDMATHPARFDERVFAPRERALIQDSAQPARMRWQLWSAKEAAFKAAKKCSPATIFSPRRFEVEVEMSDNDFGRVLQRQSAQPAESFQVRWWHVADAVHAVALRGDWRRADGSGMLAHGFRRASAAEAAGCTKVAAPSTASSAVRSFARVELARQLALSLSSIEIRTVGRVPELWLDDVPAGANLSLSHHGDWIAFACWVDSTRHCPIASASQRWAS
jgi:phosphopantetheine--protein transferase-like protein